MSDPSGLKSIVNASGFMLQLGLEHSVAESKHLHEFEVEAREHPWTLGSDSGFIDLILGRNTVRLVCECKRSRDGNWVFPIASGTGAVDRARLLWTRYGKNQLHGGWFDFALATTAPESQFCMVRGTGENDTPLLERIASRLVRSVEALAEEESTLRLLGDTRDAYRLYIPVVVTTAHLWLCEYAPSEIDLTTGELNEPQFTSAEVVLFRKALTRPSEPQPGRADEMPYRVFRRVSAEQERTVLVINSAAITGVLQHWRDGVTRNDTALPDDWRAE
jgi:hypothetical protein